MSHKRSPAAALAETVAIDLNNPLAYIVSNLRYCQDILGRGTPDAKQVEELRAALADVLQGVDKMRFIVRDLKLIACAEEGPELSQKPTQIDHVTTAEQKASKRLIAVIDDDDLMGAAMVQMLQESYEVVSFTDARVALEWLRTHEPALVLCDIVMPQMNGPEFYRALAETGVFPLEHVIFVTGNGHGEPTASFLDSIENPRIFKPFEPDALRALVRAIARSR